MNLTEYNHFTEELRLKLAGDDRVLALVAVGSMAQQDYQPDEWSDHDFFVITIHGVQEDMRRDLSWLPRPDELVFSFRETEHGMKALYAGGHLLEFAIFNKDELQMARINRYQVLLDKAEIAPKLAELALTTQDFAAQASTNPNRRFAEFLMNLFVGVGPLCAWRALERSPVHQNPCPHPPAAAAGRVSRLRDAAFAGQSGSVSPLRAGFPGAWHRNKPDFGAHPAAGGGRAVGAGGAGATAVSHPISRSGRYRSAAHDCQSQRGGEG
jgi:hypothetical protein